MHRRALSPRVDRRTWSGTHQRPVRGEGETHPVRTRHGRAREANAHGESERRQLSGYTLVRPSGHREWQATLTSANGTCVLVTKALPAYAFAPGKGGMGVSSAASFLDAPPPPVECDAKPASVASQRSRRGIEGVCGRLPTGTSSAWRAS